MHSLVLIICPVVLFVLLQSSYADDPIPMVPDVTSSVDYGSSPVMTELLEDASKVFETMRSFLTTLNHLDRIRQHEGKRDEVIRRYGVKRGDKGFQITGWRKRRSTMESEFVTSMFTGKLDHLAKDTLLAIYQFVDGMEKARNYYENEDASMEMQNAFQRESSLRQRDVV